MIERRAAAPDLYSYTCEHRSDLILESGVITPAARLATPRQRDVLASGPRSGRLAAQVVWFTTLSDLMPGGQRPCTVTNVLARCDAQEFRFRAMPGQPLEPWGEVRQAWPADVVFDLEDAAEIDPYTWWVSGTSINVLLVPRIIAIPVR